MVLLYITFMVLLANQITAQNKCLDSALYENEITDYYWREYVGEIPCDAIPGGFDKSGNPAYIGQMYHSKFGLLPATITKGSQKALASGGGSSFTSDTFVKILCSRHHDRYKWVPTENANGHLLTNYHLVIGGNEAGYVLNIGRVNHEMEVVIGKVFAHHTPYRGLSIPNKAKEAVYQSYEILVYDYCYYKPCNTTDISNVRS
ncbi:uncharacterized protein LOC116178712 [Photinus pyralis]|uniref:Uncharacterized protein n=1 Tax=Photinus pyralis TaxID=7054 RepID=A0A1Y1LI82_PHOPY|nr:uncharacterized protein LOC116178712 [Photinus pyralis]